MIDFKDEERKIIITLQGDKEDYLNTLKTLVFILGNQNPQCPLTSHETMLITNLIGAMLPEVADFTHQLKAV